MSISPPRSEASLAVRNRLYADASRAALRGLGVNVSLVIIKLVAGVTSNSAALIADAVNSIGDVASAIAVRSALHVAQTDEDDDHPYGHTKAESIAGLCVGLLVAFSAAVLALETIKGFGDQRLVPGLIAGGVAATCGIVKEITYRHTLRVARRTDSAALKAVAWDYRSDAIGSGMVAVSLLVAPYLGPIAKYVDPAAAICVCGILIFNGLRIFRGTAIELMDQQAEPQIVDHVRTIGVTVDGVADVEKLRVRRSGMEYFIEIHIEVDGELTVEEGHRIAHKVKDRLLLEMPRVRDVHVHVEPHHNASLSR
ncbi:MAG: cation diffusion facilitator family transporter [Rubripirellula sp.]|nr:cation diffusion facilitator family transporter [Rubripirellula sp.]